MSLKKISLFLFICFVLSSCQTKQKSDNVKNRYQNLDLYLSEYDQSLKDYKYVLTLSSHGCMTCNRTFATFAEKFINSDSVLIVLLDSGARIDISPFENKDNTVDDYRLKILEYGFNAVSSIYMIEESSIDTVITISSNNVEKLVNDFPVL